MSPVLLTSLLLTSPALAAPSLDQVIRDFTLSQTPVRTGPYSAELGPMTIRRLITRVTLDPGALSVVPMSGTRFTVSGPLVAKVNGPKRPFVVTFDLGVTEGSCEGWLTPLAVPVSVVVDFYSPDQRGVRAEVSLGAVELATGPAAEHLVFCDAASGGAMIAAAAAWVEAVDVLLVQSYEDGLNAYLASIPELTLYPLPPPPAPDVPRLPLGESLAL